MKAELRDPQRAGPVPRPWPRWLLAVGLVSAATIARVVVQPVVGTEVPFAFHFAAVMAAAWVADFAGGVMATVGSALAVGFFIIEPRQSLAVASSTDVAATLLFVVLSLGISWQASQWRRLQTGLVVSREALRERAEKLELHATLLDNAYDAIMVRDSAQRVVVWNREAERLFGWTAAEAVGHDLHQLLETDADARRAMSEALEATGTWSGTIRHRRKDGSTVISESRQAVAGSGVVLEVSRDVTERLHAERSARDSQQLLQTTMEHFPTVIAFKDRDGRFIDVNPAVEKALGLPRDQIIGRSLDRFMPPGAADVLRQHDLDVMASRRAMQFEEVTPLPGRTLYYLDTNFPLIDSAGRVYGTGHISYDMTEVREAQAALRANERSLTALMDAATESIFLLDRDKVLAANATAAARLGATVEQVRGARWGELLPNDLARSRFARMEEVFATGRPVQFEDQRAGMLFEHTFYPAFDAHGAVAAVAAFSRDVTQSRRTQAALHEMSQRLTYHVNHSPLAVIEFGSDMRLTAWTGEAARLFGWTADEVLGKRMNEFPWVYEEDVAAVAAVSVDLQTGTDVKRFSSNRNRRKDGTLVHCDWYNSALLDASGRLQSILSLVLDVTERKRLEQQLRARADELATANRVKDEFLATLSHELRTPLHAIIGWSQLLASTEALPPSLERGLAIIRRNAQVQGQLVGDLLDVSRILTGSFKLDLQHVDMASIVSDAVDGVGPAAQAKQIALRADVSRGLTFDGDPVRLQQMLWNLLSNAVKFTPPGGDVAVRAGTADGDVEVVVTDTGAGIRPEFLPHVFDRFSQADHSMVRAHGGLGLGLAIVRHIVELHGGSVTAASQGEGRGSTFTVRLPAGAGASRSPRHLPPAHDAHQVQ